MSLLITDIHLPATEDEQELRRRIAKQCGVDAHALQSVRVVRRALDARRKDDIHFLLHALVETDGATQRRLLSRGDARIGLYTPPEAQEPVPGVAALPGRIVVAGLGPAGLFCAYELARCGYAPLVVERGEPVEKRVQSVLQFWRGGALNRESNVMFGEGGAGTFSDGKLTSRSKDARQGYVLGILARFGAPDEICVDAKPHIGTDRLRTVVSGLRREIARLGGEIAFSTRLDGIFMKNGAIGGVVLTDAQGVRRVACGALVLAVGQGARDTCRMLFEAGVAMQKKPFAVGVRIEHPQSLIDAAQFGALAGNPRLGAASYALTGKSGARGVYTFCMCPGGSVIAGASDGGQVVVNGMSDYARGKENANAAIVVQVHDGDMGAHPLDGMRFQEEMERAAFAAGGGGFIAPAMRVGDFLRKGKPAGFGAVAPSYRPGVLAYDLWRCLPDFVAQGVCDGILAFARRLRGFDMDDAVLTAAETRTSAPLRILRDETLQSTSHRGVYPVGEGAGYAGGIVSAAIDGLRAAQAVICRFARP